MRTDDLLEGMYSVKNFSYKLHGTVAVKFVEDILPC